MINQDSIGTVVFIKTTGEPTFLLDIENETAITRRPVQTEDGVMHLTEDNFTLNELQTMKQKIAQELEEQSYFLDQRKAFERASIDASKAPVN